MSEKKLEHEISQKQPLDKEDASPGNFVIPVQYRGLPREVAEELMSEAIPVKSGGQDKQRKQPEQYLKKIEQNEIDREEEKTKIFNQRYKELNPEDKGKFFKTQDVAQDYLRELIKDNVDTEDLRLEEALVISKLKLAYEDFRQKNPGQVFSFKLEKDIDQKVLGNLFRHLQFEMLDEIKISEVRYDIQAEKSADSDSKTIQAEPETKEAVEFEELPLALQEYRDFAQRKSLESKEHYFDVLRKANERFEGKEGIVEMKSGVPTLVLADIHARREFLVNALAKKIPELENKTAFELLEEGKINIVCAGDLVHSEAGANWTPQKYELVDGKNVWENGIAKQTEFGAKLTQIIEKIKAENNCSRTEAEEMLKSEAKYSNQKKELDEIKQKIKEVLLKKEMVRGLGAISMAADLLSKYDNFYVCRGNHDDVRGEISFASKHENEGKDTLAWTRNEFGDAFADEWGRFDQNLPLMVEGRNDHNEILVSHTTGKKTLTRDDIQNRTDKAKLSLLWSNNLTIDHDKLAQNEEQLRQELGRQGAVHIIGHRPVTHGNYREQCDGRLIQINDPNKMTVAFIPNDRKFDPNKDIEFLE